MNYIEIVAIIIFFGLAAYVSHMESKLYESFIASWKVNENDSYIKLGSPAAANISRSALKIKYGFILTGDYNRKILSKELRNAARIIKIYFIVEHLIMLMLLIAGLYWI